MKTKIKFPISHFFQSKLTTECNNSQVADKNFLFVRIHNNFNWKYYIDPILKEVNTVNFVNGHYFM